MNSGHSLSLGAEGYLLYPGAFKPCLTNMKACLCCCHNEGSLCRVSFNEPLPFFLMEVCVAAEEPSLEKQSERLSAARVDYIGTLELANGCMPRTGNLDHYAACKYLPHGHLTFCEGTCFV